MTSAETERSERCSYCGGAGGNEENLEHNVRCPRFGDDESGCEGLNALRDGTRNPAAEHLAASPRRPPLTEEQADR